VPARPSGKGRCSEGKAFGNGARREVEQGLTAFVHNFEFCCKPREGGIR
jgi:hypothetical protein